MRSFQQLIPLLQPGDAVFVRADLNVPMADGVVTDHNRINAFLPTLQMLIAKKVRVALGTHLGRPQSTEAHLSTTIITNALKDKLTCPVFHTDDSHFTKSSTAVFNDLPAGSVLVLENLRFDEREKLNDVDFAQSLVGPTKYFVNDAFGCCHRAHASVVAAAGLRPSYAGLLVEKEAQVLSHLRDSADRPFWVIAGGAKVRDKIGVLAQLSGKLDGIICGGGLANTILESRGIPVGSSKTEPDALPEVQNLLQDSTELVLPVDFKAGDRLQDPTFTIDVMAGDSPPIGTSFLDIGPQSMALFSKKLQQAATIFWNGPVGVFETPEFRKGTEAIASTLANHPGFVVIGGGDSAAAARSMGIAQNVCHVSTGGGAALEFLEGKTLPGLAPLFGSQEPTSE
ncbi:MAG: phosphoglycerate kinase [Planctomycetota bacterium]